MRMNGLRENESVVAKFKVLDINDTARKMYRQLRRTFDPGTTSVMIMGMCMIEPELGHVHCKVAGEELCLKPKED